MVCSCGHAGKGVPHRPAVSLASGIVPLFDHLLKQLGCFGIAVVVDHRCPELLQCIQRVGAQIWISSSRAFCFEKTSMSDATEFLPTTLPTIGFEFLWAGV